MEIITRKAWSLNYTTTRSTGKRGKIIVRNFFSSKTEEELKARIQYKMLKIMCESEGNDYVKYTVDKKYEKEFLEKYGLL